MVNGLLTHYEVSGKGPLLLILHGWGDDSRGWAKVQHALSKTHMVVAPDLPGFGGTEAPKKPWGLDEYASFTEAFLRKIDAHEPAAILAHSNGGAIAIRGLANNNFQAQKLVLLGSAGIRNEYNCKKKLTRLLAKAGKLFVAPLPESVKNRLRRKVYTSIGSDMFVAEHLQDTFKKIVTDDIQSDAPKVSIPTLLIYGENDVSTPIRYGKKLEQLMPHAKLKVVPGAEHFVHHDQFEQVMNLVEEFL